MQWREDNVHAQCVITETDKKTKTARGFGNDRVTTNDHADLL